MLQEVVSPQFQSPAPELSKAEQAFVGIKAGGKGFKRQGSPRVPDSLEPDLRELRKAGYTKIIDRFLGNKPTLGNIDSTFTDEVIESALVDMLKRHEGFDATARADKRAKGNPLTLGHGRNLDTNPLTPDEQKLVKVVNGTITIDDAGADVLLKNDIKSVRKQLNSLFPWFKDLDKVRQAAMIDMAFGGPAKLKGFTEFVKAMSNRAKNGKLAPRLKDAVFAFLDSERFFDVSGKRDLELAQMLESGKFQEPIK